MRRFEIGPLVVAIAALVLLVSVFLDWYQDQTAWELFEVADVLLAVLALLALAAAVGAVAPELAYVERSWLLPVVLAAAVLVIAQLLTTPSEAGGDEPQGGVWIAFAASLVMIGGAVVTLARVSFSVAIEARERRQRVAAVDHRPPTTETGAIVTDPAPDDTAPTVAQPEAKPPPGGRRS